MPLFSVVTTMKREDYRRFLYITSFYTNKKRFVSAAALSILWSMLLCYSYQRFNALPIIGYAVGFAALILLTMVLKIERQYRLRISTDKGGTLSWQTRLDFFDDKLVTLTSEMSSQSAIEYEKFYQLLESRDYYMFYLCGGQASVLCKRDAAEAKGLGEFLKSKFGTRYKRVSAG